MPVVVLRHLEHLQHRGLAEQTIYQRARNLARLAAAIDGPLCEATPAQLQQWRAGLQTADETVVAYVSHVREFYAWCHRTGLIETNPAAGLNVPKLGRRLPRPIAEASLQEAVITAPARIRPWLVLAGWAGLRAKEIALLRRTAVLETARPPVILIARDATKGRSERAVPMSGFVLAELVPVLPRAGWVFKRRDGRPGPNTPGLVSRLANDHLHDCGFTETLHQLRHRFGTATYHASRDLRVVQELLGHQHPSTTAGYAAFDNADAIAAVEALPAPGHLRVVPRDRKNEG